MPLKTNRLLVLAGTYTLIQAMIQLMISLIAIAQYYCVIDFMRSYPLLIFIRILYFYNASSCGGDINIGQTIDGIPNQAYVYLSSTPQTALRTFVFTCVSLGLSVLWLLGSVLLIKGGFRQHHSNHTHWPWVAVTFLVSLLDMIGAVVYINDSFHTRTLRDVLQFISGTVSGLGNADLSTRWTSWTMVALYGRFGIFLVINVVLIVSIIWDCTRFRTSVTTSELERNDLTSPESSSQTKPESAEDSDGNSSKTPSGTPPKIPRPGLSQSFRSMKDLLFGRTNSMNSLNGGRYGNSSLPQLNTSAPETTRSPARQLAGQMPWAYIAGAPTNRMRDQLPPDEDLPPVPLPDYTAIISARKASVHRAASSLSSLTQKRECVNSKSSHPGSAQVDVLY